VLVFDVAESLLDLQVLRPLFQRVCGTSAEVDEWFGETILYSETATIPRSRENPKILWVDDSEVVRDSVAVGVPIPRHVVAQEGQHGDAEIPEAGVALVVGDAAIEGGGVSPGHPDGFAGHARSRTAAGCGPG
jgi:hypothetical protein